MADFFSAPENVAKEKSSVLDSLQSKKDEVKKTGPTTQKKRQSAEVQR